MCVRPVSAFRWRCIRRTFSTALSAASRVHTCRKGSKVRLIIMCGSIINCRQSDHLFSFSFEAGKSSGYLDQYILHFPSTYLNIVEDQTIFLNEKVYSKRLSKDYEVKLNETLSIKYCCFPIKGRSKIHYIYIGRRFLVSSTPSRGVMEGVFGSIKFLRGIFESICKSLQNLLHGRLLGTTSLQLTLHLVEHLLARWWWLCRWKVKVKVILHSRQSHKTKSFNFFFLK